MIVCSKYGNRELTKLKCRKNKQYIVSCKSKKLEPKDFTLNMMKPKMEEYSIHKHMTQITDTQ